MKPKKMLQDAPKMTAADTEKFTPKALRYYPEGNFIFADGVFHFGSRADHKSFIIQRGGRYASADAIL